MELPAALVGKNFRRTTFCQRFLSSAMNKSDRKKSLGILLFEDVEVLDFAGPFEVFSVANQLADYQIFDITTIGVHATENRARNGLQVVADSLLDEISSIDVLIIPGGKGTRALITDDNVVNNIKHLARKAEKIITVCTGSLAAAKAGLLKNLKSTTHYSSYDLLKKLEPTSEILKQRYVDNGFIMCAEGVSAGIDASLRYISDSISEQHAHETARYMMYNGTWKKPG